MEPNNNDKYKFNNFNNIHPQSNNSNPMIVDPYPYQYSIYNLIIVSFSIRKFLPSHNIIIYFPTKQIILTTICLALIICQFIRI